MDMLSERKIGVAIDYHRWEASKIYTFSLYVGANRGLAPFLVPISLYPPVMR